MRCSLCPARVDSPKPCLGERHPPACGYVAAGRREWIDHLRRLAEGGPMPPDPGRVDVRLAMLADLCPAGHGCGCGSVARLCGRSDRPLEVFRIRDCLPCVARSEWEGVENVG